METGRDWLPPESFSESPGAAEASASRFELRPLSLGEILDRTFALYRSRFWLFASISAVAASVQVAVQAVSLTAMHTILRTMPVPGQSGAAGTQVALGGILRMQSGAYAVALVYFLVAAVTQAATSLAMSEVYLTGSASARAALGTVLTRWYRWIGIALWQAGSFLWVPLLGIVPGFLLLTYGSRSGNLALTGIGGVLLFVAVFGGFAVGFVLYLRNALAVPAAVVERLTIRPAMRRSKVLAAGTKGRIFVVLLIAGCLYSVVAVLESPASLLIMIAPKGDHYLVQASTLLISFLGRTVVAPVLLIGLTLVYFDQRVRKEALDIELLLQGSRAEGSFPAASASLPTGGLPTL